MTTVAANRHGMAADSRINTSDLHYRADKVFRVGNAIAGGCGETALVEAWVEWLRDGSRGRKPNMERDADFAGLYLDSSGLYHVDWSCRLTPVNDPFFAIGSGAMAALAAMHCGKSPVEAVTVACMVDVNSGLPVTELALPKRRR